MPPTMHPAPPVGGMSSRPPNREAVRDHRKLVPRSFQDLGIPRRRRRPSPAQPGTVHVSRSDRRRRDYWRGGVHTIGEVGLIQRIRRRVGSARSVQVGIGDDAAVLRLSMRAHTSRKGTARTRLLMTSDMLIEGVHFLRRRVPAEWVGWKAMASSVSDIAAMGGVPRWAVVSLGVPRTTSVAFVDRLYAGLSRCARRFGCAIVGGDTVRAPQVVVDVTIVGTVTPDRLTLRSGARVGDRLFVTGALGGSYRSGRHARFLPRLAVAQRLVKRFPIHAMIDLSDGLAQDLWQVSRASKTIVRVDVAQIPVASSAVSVHQALTEGEDFELLFAVSPQVADRLPSRLGGVAVTYIGAVISKGIGVELAHSDGRVTPLLPTGFRHF